MWATNRDKQHTDSEASEFHDPTVTPVTGVDILAAVGSPVRLNHCPNWMRLQVIRTHCMPMPYRGTGSIMEFIRQRYHAGEWLDHWGSTVVDGKTCFVSEPYGISSDSIDDLLAFCIAINCRCEISATSAWFPTRTIRILIHPPENPALKLTMSKKDRTEAAYLERQKRTDATSN